jgi:hypothetical protein
MRLDRLKSPQAKDVEQPDPDGADDISSHLFLEVHLYFVWVYRDLDREQEGSGDDSEEVQPSVSVTYL